MNVNPIFQKPLLLAVKKIFGFDDEHWAGYCPN
jgi:hypothetical protein